MTNDFDPLAMISPVDGRYHDLVSPLRPYVTESALIRYRVLVEIEWFIYLVQRVPELNSGHASKHQELAKCRQLVQDFSLTDAKSIRNSERETNHDVKAVELFLRDKFSEFGLGSLCELIHFGCTSEDINNLAYALILRDARHEVLLPKIFRIVEEIVDSADALAAVPMLARTHGQPATPTTVGKELALFAYRLHKTSHVFRDVPILGKMNGAVGNFNAHKVACPDIDWIKHSQEFVRSLGLTPNLFTSQIESHDFVSNYCNALQQINSVLLDFVRDIWTYISMDYFRQNLSSGEVGSSTMPHKVNPIDFENAEGNVGIANALLHHLSVKLPISRMQRDLSDSTVLRNIGVAFGHTFIALDKTSTGLKKLAVNKDRLHEDLMNAWEVLTEAVQTVMRRNGIENAYELVKNLTRGEQLDKTGYQCVIQQLPLSETDKDLLSSLEPQNYVGFAPEITARIIQEIRGPR